MIERQTDRRTDRQIDKDRDRDRDREARGERDRERKVDRDRCVCVCVRISEIGYRMLLSREKQVSSFDLYFLVSVLSSCDLSVAISIPFHYCVTSR